MSSPAGKGGAAGGPSSSFRVRVVTQNVWFASHAMPERGRALVRALVACGADVVCLQEVTPALFVDVLRAPGSPLLELFEFSDTSPRGLTLGSYGVLVLVRRSRGRLVSSRLVELPTKLGRSLLAAVVTLSSSPAAPGQPLTGGGAALSQAALDTATTGAPAAAETEAKDGASAAEAAAAALGDGDAASATTTTTLVVGTVHLESIAGNAPTRAAQLERIFPFLTEAAQDPKRLSRRGGATSASAAAAAAAAGSASSASASSSSSTRSAPLTSGAILCGDFNFCGTSDEDRANVDPAVWTDSWTALRPEDDGWTEDTARNAMLFADKRRQKQVRFDRILVGPTRIARWRPVAVEIFRPDPITVDQAGPFEGGPGTTMPDSVRALLDAGKLWISDHFGLIADLEWTDNDDDDDDDDDDDGSPET